MLTDDEILQMLKDEVQPKLEGFHLSEVRFYGAGCRDAQVVRVTKLLQQTFLHAKIVVASDLFGAAMSLCGKSPGIACILGTGSNSCLYDGSDIIANTPALGYILGDEGSGAVLGRRLLADLLKGQLSSHITELFHNEYGETTADVIHKVYRSPFPNRYLASFAPFLKRYEASPEIREILESEFVRFLQRNIHPYGRKDLPVHFVGGVAYHFQEILVSCVTGQGYKVGNILQAPFDAIQNL